MHAAYLENSFKIGANALLNIIVWLVAFAIACLIASMVNMVFFTIAGGILVDFINNIFLGRYTLVEEIRRILEWHIIFIGFSFVFGAYIAIVPAILGSGVWEALGYQPPLIWQTLAGATAGGLATLVMSGTDLAVSDLGLMVIFTTAGAAGGLSFGLVRRHFLRSRRYC